MRRLTDASNQSTSDCPSLAAPTLTATGSHTQVSLSWTAVAGASSYNVLRNNQRCSWGYNLIANVPGTSYTDTGLPNGFPAMNQKTEASTMRGRSVGADLGKAGRTGRPLTIGLWTYFLIGAVFGLVMMSFGGGHGTGSVLLPWFVMMLPGSLIMYYAVWGLSIVFGERAYWLWFVLAPAINVGLFLWIRRLRRK